MTVTELREKIAECNEAEASILRAIDAVPDSLPDSLFNARLNRLEAEGIRWAERREEYERQLGHLLVAA